MVKMNHLKFISFIGILTFLVTFISLDQTEAAKAPKGSQIGNVPIEKLKDDEIKQKLLEEIDIWQTGEDLILKSDYEKFTIPRTAIIFDIDATLAEFKERTKRELTNFFMKEKNVHLPLKLQINEALNDVQQIIKTDYIDDKQTLLNVTDLAENLEEGTISIVYLEDKEIELDTIAEETFAIPKDLSDVIVTYIINEIDGQIIAPDHTFSFLTNVELPKKMTRSTKELSFLASTIYSLMLKTNIDIISRETNTYQPSYIDAGLDVYVNPAQNIDFITHNPGEFSFKINAERVKDELKLSLKSHALDVTYDYELKNKKEVKERTIYRYNHRIAPGQSELVEQGVKGFTAKLYRNAYNKNGVLIDSELMSEEFSLPKPRIVLLSPDDPIIESESDETADSDDLSDIDEDLDDKDEIDLSDEIASEEMIDSEDLEVEIARIEKEWEKTFTQLIDQLNKQNKQLTTEFETNMKQFIKVVELMESDDDEEIEEKLIEIDEQLETLENDRNYYFYKFLYDFLAMEVNSGKE